MTFSLITATLGRVDEVRVLCESLSRQTFKDFELYIVDQNEHRLLEDMAKEFEHKFTIHYIRSYQKGLSLNRNIALRRATGDYFGFPDDDCYYAPDTLERVYKTFCVEPNAKFIAISSYDSLTKTPQRKSQKYKLYKKDILKCCISYNIFVHNNKILFDERLGVGTYFASGEETDYLYSQIYNKYDFGVFCPKASVFHPCMTTLLKRNKDYIEKAYKYSLGFAALQKKDWIYRHNNYALIQYTYYLLRAFIGILLIKNFRLHQKSFEGKIVGFMKFKV